MRSMKSLLGSSLIDGSTEVQGRSIPFRVLLTRFIAELKRRAETAAGRDFQRVVLGRPVFFVDDDPAADQTAQDTLGEIARQVGFTDIEFQFEPLAAAFDYESQIDREELVLVIDIGGGTSDFSLIRLGPGRAGKADRREDILAYGGVHIGGADFDKQLSLAHVMPLLGLGSQLRSGDVPSTQYGNLACWHTINQAYTRKAAEHFAYIRAEAGDRAKIDLLLNLVKERAGHWVAVQVEEAKIALSEAPEARIDLSRVGAGLAVDVTRPSFDACVGRLIERWKPPSARCCATPAWRRRTWTPCSSPAAPVARPGCAKACRRWCPARAASRATCLAASAPAWRWTRCASSAERGIRRAGLAGILYPLIRAGTREAVPATAPASQARARPARRSRRGS